jgi:hypothetical protein
MSRVFRDMASRRRERLDAPVIHAGNSGLMKLMFIFRLYMDQTDISPQKVHEFLDELAVTLTSAGDTTKLAERLTRTKKYFLIPLTSEFYGEAMRALEQVVNEDPPGLSFDQRERASLYATKIKNQWFSPPPRR